jgi:hypothetical protein
MFFFKLPRRVPKLWVYQGTRRFFHVDTSSVGVVSSACEDLVRWDEKDFIFHCAVCNINAVAIIAPIKRASFPF